MAEYRFQTRDELAVAAYKANRAKYNNMSPEAVYEDFVSQFPEYKTQVAENFPVPEPLINDPEIELASDEKNVFTGIKEIFSSDFYKYVPFIRDAEIFESGAMLARANRVKNGTASEEDILAIKKFTMDQERETSWGYNTLKIMAGIPAFAIEILGTVATLGTLGGVKLGTKGALMGSKAATKTAVKQAAKRIKLNEAAKQGTKLNLKQKVERSLLNTAAGVGSREFARTLAEGAKYAKKHTLKEFVQENTKDGLLKGINKTGKQIAKTIGKGAAGAAMMSAFRSPQAVNEALKKMSPVFMTDEGLDGEIALRLLDDGDDVLPALAKAYAEQGIEFFTEQTGESLYIMHHMFGGEMLRAGAVKAVKAGYSKVPGQEKISAAFVNPPLKAALAKHFEKFKPAPELKEILKNAGWNGVLAEMYEERVGGLIRKVTPGLEGEILPPLDQLLSEAVAFTLFGGMASAADVASRSQILGGAGIESHRKAQKLREIDPTSEDSVLLENEVDALIDEHIDLAKEQAEDPGYIARILRKIKIGKFEPFANYEARGSVSEAVSLEGGQNIDVRIRKAISEGKTDAEIKEDIKGYLTEFVKNQGIRQVSTEADRERFKMLMRRGEARFVKDAEGRGYFHINMNEIVKRHAKGKARRADVRKQSIQQTIDMLSQDRSTIYMSSATYEQLDQQGSIEGTDITHLFDTKNPESAPAIGDIMNLFNMSSPAEAEALFDTLKKTLAGHRKQNKNARDKQRVSIRIMPNIAIVDTGAEVVKKGYALKEGESETDQFATFVSGKSEIDPTDPNHIIIGLAPTANKQVLFEELIEGVTKITADDHATVQFIYNDIIPFVKKSGLDGYSGIETIAKAFLGGVFGTYTGYEADKWNNLEFTQNQKDLLRKFYEQLLGKDVIALMEAGQAEEKADADSEKASPKETTESQEEAKKTKKQELTEKVKDAKESQEIDSDTAEEIVEEIGTAVSEALADELRDEGEGEPVRKLRSLNQQVQKLQQQINTDASPESIVNAAFDLLNNSDASFSLNIVNLGDNLTEDAALERAMATYNDYMHDQAILLDINSSRFAQEINKIFGGQGTALEYLYQILRANKETREAIVKILETPERFQDFLDNPVIINELRVLHEAMTQILKPDGVEVKDVQMTLLHMARRYENMNIVPVYELDYSGKKPLVKVLNKGYNEVEFRNFIYKHVNMILKRTSAAELKEVWAGAYTDGSLSYETMVRNFATITGLKKELFESFQPHLLRRFYDDFLIQLNLASNDVNRSQSAERIARFFYETKAGTAYPSSLLTYLLKFNPLYSGLKISYRNTAGEKELALRGSSHLTEARNAIAAELGIKPDDTLAMLSGVRNFTYKGKGAQKLLGIERNETLFDLFESEEDFYWQSVGQMGGKNHIYLFRSKKYKPEELKQALKEYTEAYNTLKSTNPSVDKFQVTPEELIKEINKLKNLSGDSYQKQLFKINTIINKQKIDKHLHGDYNSYDSIDDLTKRASQIPTPGFRLDVKEKVNFVIIDDKGVEFTDGMGIYVDDFGKIHADYMGEIYAKGTTSSNSIKPNVSYVDNDGNRIQIKGNLINAELVKELKGYKEVVEWVKEYNKNNPDNKIDLIIPASMAKKGFRGQAQGTLDNLPTDPVIQSMPGKEFVTVQNLNFDTQASVRNQAKQQITDTLVGAHSERIAELANQNSELLLNLIDQNFDILFSNEAAETELEIKKSKGDISKVSEKAKTVINKIAKGMTAYAPGSEGEMAADLIETVQEILRAHQWSNEADAEYFDSVFKALNAGVSEYDPQVSEIVEQIKSRYIVRAIRKQFPRLQMQKIGNIAEELPSFEAVGKGKVRLPMMISNTQGVRVSKDGFKSIKEARDYINANREEHLDMFEIKNGVVSNKIRTYEIRTPEESAKLGLSGYTIPGGLIIESRIPGENLQSHIPHRLLKPVNKNYNGNFSMSPFDVSDNKGEDFDGDIGYQFILYQNPKNTIEDNRNLQLLLMTDTYTQEEYLDVVQTNVRNILDQFKDLVGDKEVETAKNNTVEAERIANTNNGTALDALGRVAQYVKFYDIAEHLEFELNELQGMYIFGNSSINYHPTGRQADAKINTAKRKAIYATAMVNITVDNATDQLMPRLNFDEITTPIAQALLFLQTDLNESNLQEKVQDIVDFLETGMVKAYVAARREMESIDFYRSKYKDQTRIEIIATLMQQKGYKDTSGIKKMQNIDRIIQEVGVLASLIDSQYNAPKKASELRDLRSKLNNLKNGKMEIFNTSNAKKGDDLAPILVPIEQVLNHVEEKAFNKNLLLSKTTESILFPEFTKAELQKPYVLDAYEKLIKRGLSIKAVYKNERPDYIQDLGFLIEEIQKYQATPQGADNMFLDLLQIDPNGSNRIMINEVFHQTIIPPGLADRARAAFQELPEALQDALIRHQVLVYGMTSSTFSGGYLSLISENKRLELSKAIDVEIENYLQGNVNGPAVVKYLKDQYEKEKGGVWYLKERPNITGTVLKESLLRQDTNWLDSIPNSLLSDSNVSNAELKKEIVKAKETYAAESAVFENPFAAEIRKYNIGSDATSYSLLQYHQAVTYVSPIMMGGANGAHKRFVNLINEADTTRIMGRLMRENWEKRVGARQRLNRDAKKLTPEEIELGKAVLAAIGARITGSQEVVLGVEAVDMDLAEAVATVMDRYEKRYGSDVMSSKAQGKVLDRAVKAITDGVVAKRKIGNMREAYKIILEAEMREYMTTNNVDKIPINVPILMDATADQVIESYENYRTSDFSSAAEIEKEIREAFEAERKKYNSNVTTYLNKIPKRENFLPMMRSVDPYRLESLNDKKDTESNNGGQDRTLSRSSNINTFKDMIDNGYTPLTTNPADLYERYTASMSKDLYLSSVWQMMLFSTTPDQDMLVLPVFNIQELEANPFVSNEFIKAYAEKLEFGTPGLTRNKNEGPIEFIERAVKNRQPNYTEYSTGIASMPTVYVRNGQTENVVKMITNKRREGKFWEIWANLTNWTKFFAIGVPYLSWFHHFALVESQIAIGGLRNSSAYNPRKHWLDFKKFSNNLENDAEVAAKWYRAGMKATLEDPDYAQGLVNKHIEAAAAYAQANKHGSTAKALRKFISLKERWDTRLWTQLHAPLKVWTAEGLLLEARTAAQEQGKPFNEEQVIKDIADLVDQLYGGVNFQKRIWATPGALQMANNFSFAFDWTFSALGIAGAGNIPGLDQYFGKQSQYQNKIRYGQYVPAFLGIVMFAIPNAIQSAIWAITRPLGGDDEDQPLIMMNEQGRRSWIDLTPLYRLTPFNDLKQYGGDSGERRVYLRWGKQGYEIGDWARKPLRTAGYKLSVPLKQAIEQITGRSMGGWDLAFKDADYFGVFEANGKFLDGRIGHSLKMFMPFSVQDIINHKPTPVPGVPINFAKMKQGKHGWYASKQLSELYLAYIKKGNFEKLQDHRRNIMLIGLDILHAAQKNGFDAVKVQKTALANARAELYTQLEDAMKKNRIDDANKIAVRLRGLEASAWSIKNAWKKASVGN